MAHSSRFLAGGRARAAAKRPCRLQLIQEVQWTAHDISMAQNLAPACSELLSAKGQQFTGIRYPGKWTRLGIESHGAPLSSFSFPGFPDCRTQAENQGKPGGRQKAIRDDINQLRHYHGGAQAVARRNVEKFRSGTPGRQVRSREREITLLRLDDA